MRSASAESPLARSGLRLAKELHQLLAFGVRLRFYSAISFEYQFPVTRQRLPNDRHDHKLTTRIGMASCNFAITS